MAESLIEKTNLGLSTRRKWILMTSGTLAVLPFISGCMPPAAEKVAKPRTSKEALGRWTSVRGSRGQTYHTKHTIEGEEFDALWEITRTMGGYIKLQLKLPAEWSVAKVYKAIQLVFEEEDKQPWYYPIEDTFLQSVTRGLKSEEEKEIIPDVTPDMPYETTTTVIKRKNEYFIEMVARLIPGVE
jgi:hypothetical protein